MKDVKIVIGANYGDEGKGLMTHYFTKQAMLHGETPIVVLHNGTAQRGHTVEYYNGLRHVFHHFGCGTYDGAPTYFARTYMVHPMEFVREYHTLKVTPIVYCDPEVRIITPFDMLIDHMTMDYIAVQNGEREHGTCGLGSWCATDRFQMTNNIFTLKDFMDEEAIPFVMACIWKNCLAVLAQRRVNIDAIPQYKIYFDSSSVALSNLIYHFSKDIKFFLDHVTVADFDCTYKLFNSIIFEGAQGLGLDIDCGSEWHTTSHTGVYNPYMMLKDKTDFNAEVCYVTRSYLTRHGIGELENEAPKEEINTGIIDKTNIFNDFQGGLRFSFIAKQEQSKRIEKDMGLITGPTQNNFTRTMAITHCNEFTPVVEGKYISDSPFYAKLNK